MTKQEPIDPLPERKPQGKCTDLTALVKQTQSHGSLLIVELTNNLSIVYEKEDRGIRYCLLPVFFQDGLDVFSLCGLPGLPSNDESLTNEEIEIKIRDYTDSRHFLEKQVIKDYSASQNQKSPISQQLSHLCQKREELYQKMIAPLNMQQKFVPDPTLASPSSLAFFAVGTVTWPITGPLGLLALYFLSKERSSEGALGPGILALGAAGAPLLLLWGVKEFIFPSYQVYAIKNKEILKTAPDGKSAALSVDSLDGSIDKIVRIGLQFPDGSYICESWSSAPHPDASYTSDVTDRIYHSAKYFLPIDDVLKQEYRNVADGQCKIYKEEEKKRENFFEQVSLEDHIQLLQHLKFVDAQELEKFREFEKK